MSRDFYATIKKSPKTAESFLKTLLNKKYKSILKRYGALGVEELSKNTPKRTGKTASSWSYEIKETKDSITISWNNSNRSDGALVVMLLYYGHVMPNGSYVQGVDFINPALEPIFKKMSEEVWEEVLK